VFTQCEGAGNWWPFVPTTDVEGAPGTWTAEVHYAESGDAEAPVKLWAWAVDEARHAELLAQLPLAIAVPIAETPDTQECDDERQLNRRP